jgi:hypothetical protein
LEYLNIQTNAAKLNDEKLFLFMSKCYNINFFSSELYYWAGYHNNSTYICLVPIFHDINNYPEYRYNLLDKIATGFCKNRETPHEIMNIFEFIYDLIKKDEYLIRIFCNFIISASCMYDHLHAFQWVLRFNNFSITKSSIDNAIQNESVKVLKYCVQNSLYEFENIDCYNGIIQNNLEILKILYNSKPIIDKYSIFALKKCNKLLDNKVIEFCKDNWKIELSLCADKFLKINWL